MTTTRCVQITLRGRLSRRLADLFDGMAVSDSASGTRLEGTIADQAQLHGLLTRVRDLGLELESVTTSEAPADRPSQRPRATSARGIH